MSTSTKIIVDVTHIAQGGTIRGFLNDGTTDYSSHTSVDSLAFGRCDYPYRNLGRPSVVRLKYTNSIFEVTVDEKPCFSTNKVSPLANSPALSNSIGCVPRWKHLRHNSRDTREPGRV